MAGMDWIAALAGQDQSLESLMAKRDLSKQIQQLQQVGNEAENRRQFEENQDRQREALREQIALRKAQQAETFQNRKEARERQAREDKQNRYNTVADNLHRQVGAGITPHVDPETAAMMREFEGPASVEDVNAPVPKPEGFVGPVDNQPKVPDWVYAKQEAEAAAMKAKHAEERQKAQDVMAQEHLRLAKESGAREEDRLKIAQAKEDRAKSAAESKQKLGASLMERVGKIPGARKAIEARAKQLQDENASLLDLIPGPWQKVEKVQDYWIQAGQEVLEGYQKAGQLPPDVPITHVPAEHPGGQGAAPGAQVKETPAERKARLMAKLGGG